jgi:hypothetical protein
MGVQVQGISAAGRRLRPRGKLSATDSYPLALAAMAGRGNAKRQKGDNPKRVIALLSKKAGTTQMGAGDKVAKREFYGHSCRIKISDAARRRIFKSLMML